MKRISILNFKGGVGKTSISTNSAHKLALMGYKVLLIDCDIQANASNLIPQKDRKTVTAQAHQEVNHSLVQNR